MDILQNHWESIHSEKFKDVSWWQNEDALWLDLFENANLPHNAAIIDVGSGASLLIDQLHNRGFTDLSVLDISESALSRLRSEIIQDRFEVGYYCADVLTFTAERSFDVWHDRAVFHFLTEPADQAKYVESVKRNVKVGGLVIIATFSPDGPDKCSNLPIAKHDVTSLQTIFGKDFSLISSEIRLHTTPWGSTQSFTVASFRFSA